MPDINPDPSPCDRCGGADPEHRGAFGYPYLCGDCRDEIGGSDDG